MKKVLMVFLVLFTFSLFGSNYGEKIATYYDLKNAATNTVQKVSVTDVGHEVSVCRTFAKEFKDLGKTFNKKDPVESILKRLCNQQYIVYEFTADNMISKRKKDILSRERDISNAIKEIEVLEIELEDTIEYEGGR